MLKPACIGSIATANIEQTQDAFVPIRTVRNGRNAGGTRYSRGALYRLLQNRLYLGEIPHNGNVYPGQHAAIVSHELWDKVQTQLQDNDNAHRIGSTARESSLLVGLVYDQHGQRVTSFHTSKSGKRYRYYVLRTAGPGGEGSPRESVRIPAAELEVAVRSTLQSLLSSELVLMSDGIPNKSLNPACRQ